MRDSLRIHYYFILGAFGGLNGWFLSAILLPESATYNFYSRQAVFGALIGASTSATLAAYPGIRARPLARVVNSIAFGIVRGALAGGVALITAQYLYSTTSAVLPVGVVPVSHSFFALGVFTWVLFGGLIGLGTGLDRGTRGYKSLLGGMLGGFAGGLPYEIGRTYSLAGYSPYEQQIILALTLALLCGVIGISIALTPHPLKAAWIEVVSGEYAGRTFDVTKFVKRANDAKELCIIGSDKQSAHIYLPDELGLLPRHAVISYEHGAPTLSTLPEAQGIGTVLVNGRPTTRMTVREGDQLQIGSTVLIYRSRPQ